MKSGGQKTQGEPGWIRETVSQQPCRKNVARTRREMPIVILPRHAPLSGEILARKTPPGVSLDISKGKINHRNDNLNKGTTLE